MTWLLRTMNFSALLLAALAFGFLADLASGLQIILPVSLAVLIGCATKVATNKRTYHAVRDVHRMYLAASGFVAAAFLLAYLFANALATEPVSMGVFTATAASLTILFISQFIWGYRKAAYSPILYLVVIFFPAQPPATVVWLLFSAAVAALGLRRRMRP